MEPHQFVIEKNIPPPGNRKGRYYRYPFGDMQVGDSIFVPAAEATADKVRTAASYYRARHPGYTFSIRKTENPAGCRVWRVEANNPGQPTRGT